ncbi:cryptochrome/photolyase family protein [Enhygromyxa salina]|uniref:Deoxyribodipyrimidine photo-lyase n=1 Tax=Enhygromyxa salina TaxID=215803 RepID=A0A2S9YJG3_9BACT|nr:cryptochrome/photolyase family protein [Enhygromyxa salina]PRQ05239.1 Deoxyribodipyrimidine photo-lyase [Enhygromyxa salina]
MSASPQRLLVLFGDQLFAPSIVAKAAPDAVFMLESRQLCDRYRYHKHKLILELSAMRSLADALCDRGISVVYRRLEDDDGRPFIEALDEALTNTSYSQLAYFELESPTRDQQLAELCAERSLEREVLPSPMFLTGHADFERYVGSHQRLFMGDFYRWQRQRLGILLEDDGRPVGGAWSFDEDNRKRLPHDLTPPALYQPQATDHTKSVIDLVDGSFPENPGDAANFWLPTTHRKSRAALNKFLAQRLQLFGDYEDALSSEHTFVFHSVLSPMLNMGLLTPRQVLEAALRHAEANNTPLNSLEGFVRQVIGWREFVRGVWHTLPAAHWDKNFWNHSAKLTPAWYDGTTGIPPLDHAIGRAQRHGYCHHIERLMVLGNLMLLCRVDPTEVYRWFMEMFVDSAEWVMAPNVHGMALHSEGGAFTTKPYICGSNYLRKMSDYQGGPWCDVVDGLYWSFVADHEEFFASNARTAMMVRTLARLDSARKQRIFEAARQFRDRVTAKTH